MPKVPITLNQRLMNSRKLFGQVSMLPLKFNRERMLLQIYNSIRELTEKHNGLRKTAKSRFRRLLAVAKQRIPNESDARSSSGFL